MLLCGSKICSGISYTELTVIKTEPTNSVSAAGIPPAPPSVSAAQPLIQQPRFSLLPQTTPFKVFTGQDPSYNAYTFISECDDVRTSMHIQDPSEKISQVRSQCAPDSEARIILRTRPPLPAHVGYTYKLFKENFLKSFGGSQSQSGIEWIFDLANVIKTEHSSQSPVNASAIATDFATIMINK